MVPREILFSTRSVFVQAFQHAIQNMVSRVVEALFAKANACDSVDEQQDVFRARALLQERREEFMQRLPASLEQLLNRSMETTYQTFRPASTLMSRQISELSLLDTLAFENSLRFNNITELFRSTAGQELIDLNIRIAVLFGQDDICERENPFRPYLLTRCISQTIEELQLTSEISAILIAQVSDCLNDSVPEMYRVANADLEAQGIEAHLSLKINKAPDSLSARPATGNEGSAEAGAAFPVLSAEHMAQSHTAPPALQVPENKPSIHIEQLFDAVRGGALRATFPVPPSVSSPVSQPTSQSIPSYTPGWLDSVDDLGAVLRSALGISNDISPTARSSSRTPSSVYAPLTSVRTIPASFSQAPQASVTGQNIVYPKATLDLLAQLGIAARSEAVPDVLTTPVGGDQVTAVNNPLPDGFGLVNLLGRLHKRMVPAVVDLLDEQGEVRNLLREQREVLMSLATTDKQQMTLDLMTMLFEAILSDALVSLELRQKIAGFQYLLLQLALTDHSFLVASQHPARLLFNRITSVALSLQQLESIRPQFEEEIARIFKTLARHDCEVPSLFERIHNRFDTFISRELRTADKTIRRAVKSIEEAQIRYLQFEQTASLMGEGLRTLNLPGHFQAFLQREWVKAINLAELQDPKIAQRFRLMVPDIIWSISPKVTPDERNQLSAMLPSILANLKRGIQMLGWNQFKQSALLNWLSEAHSKALRVAETGNGLVLNEVHKQFAGLLNEQVSGMADAISKDQYTEVYKYLDEVLLDLGLSVRLLDIQSDQTNDLPISIQASKPVEWKDIKERLYSGIALEMSIDGQFRRGCVHWINPNENNLVLSFVGMQDPMIAEVTEFCRRVSRGLVKFAENAPLFDRAIYSLLKSADAIKHLA